MAVQNTRGKIVFEAAQKRFLCAVSVNPKHAGEITVSTQRNDAAKDLAVILRYMSKKGTPRRTNCPTGHSPQRFHPWSLLLSLLYHLPTLNATKFLFCCVRKNQKNKVPNSTKSLFCCRSRNHWLLRSCLDIKKTHLPALSVHQRTTTCQAPKLQERQKSAVNNGAFCIFAQIICRPWHI